MNIDLILMLGALVLLAISGLLVFCFTESKGKNTQYARKSDSENSSQPTKTASSSSAGRVSMEKTLV
jgi:hypothetical protein